MLVIAVVNGAVRDFVYRKRIGELAAHQLSTVIGSSLFLVYIRAIIHVWRPASPQMALGVGLLWLALTLVFEFGFGRARKLPWTTLLRDYNIFAGRLWILVLLVVTFAPLLFYYL